jgi:hypothetical protein
MAIMLSRSLCLPLSALLACLAAVAVAGCGKKKDDPKAASSSTGSVAPRETAAPATAAGATSAVASTTAVVAATPPAGSPPADGKYERVQVNGVTVPMVQVMNGGAVILVDTDGKKPRTWEEQYKRKGNIPLGSYDIHKTAKDGKFDKAPVDKEGLWVIDAKGNLTRH